MDSFVAAFHDHVKPQMVSYFPMVKSYIARWPSDLVNINEILQRVCDIPHHMKKENYRKGGVWSVA